MIFKTQFLRHTCSFVDRDMFMRYRGSGVGHQAVREATNSFLNDRPLEELCARDKAATAQHGDDPRTAMECESEAEDKVEGEGEQIEAEINWEDIPDGDNEIINDDNREEEEEEEEEEEDTESDSDDEEGDAAPDVSEYSDF